MSYLMTNIALPEYDSWECEAGKDNYHPEELLHGPRGRDPVREAVDGGTLTVARDILAQDLPHASTSPRRYARPPDHHVLLLMF